MTELLKKLWFLGLEWDSIITSIGAAETMLELMADPNVLNNLDDLAKVVSDDIGLTKDTLNTIAELIAELNGVE